MFPFHIHFGKSPSLISLIPPKGVTAQDTRGQRGQPEPCPGEVVLSHKDRRRKFPAVPSPPTDHKKTKKTFIQECHGHSGLASECQKVKAWAGGGVQNGGGPSPMQVRWEGGGFCRGLGSILRSPWSRQQVSCARGPWRRWRGAAGQ